MKDKNTTIFENIPEKLRGYESFCVWENVDDNIVRKTPRQLNMKNARVNDPSTF